ncbi:hypothetical protein ACSFA0_24010 [Variovorax sp. LT1P1]|uniref:hypothetical protein n=1 Tax=Variovorax sp. LT1P1 TaxID=3443730 RepID=UPI003F46F304
MDAPPVELSAEIWIAACAHRLQQRWRTVDPVQLEEIAGKLLHDERFARMTPAQAAIEWLRPVGTSAENH